GTLLFTCVSKRARFQDSREAIPTGLQTGWRSWPVNSWVSGGPTSSQTHRFPDEAEILDTKVCPTLPLAERIRRRCRFSLFRNYDTEHQTAVCLEHDADADGSLQLPV